MFIPPRRRKTRHLKGKKKQAYFSLPKPSYATDAESGDGDNSGSGDDNDATEDKKSDNTMTLIVTARKFFLKIS